MLYCGSALCPFFRTCEWPLMCAGRRWDVPFVLHLRVFIHNGVKSLPCAYFLGVMTRMCKSHLRRLQTTRVAAPGICTRVGHSCGKHCCLCCDPQLAVGGFYLTFSIVSCTFQDLVRAPCRFGDKYPTLSARVIEPVKDTLLTPSALSSQYGALLGTRASCVFARSCFST